MGVLYVTLSFFITLVIALVVSVVFTVSYTLFPSGCWIGGVTGSMIYGNFSHCAV